MKNRLRLNDTLAARPRTPSPVPGKLARRATLLTTLAVAAALILATTAAAAFVGLPADGSQVNSDVANGIDPNQGAGASDVQGGTVLAGNLQVPWGTFEQKTGSSQQIFVRAFKGGQWVTQGFPASLNIDPTVEAEEPAIDFAGTGRTVPWVSWQEPNSFLGGNKQIFASRFSAAANVWLPAGQDRAPGHGLPSLNINTDRNAENPALAGGAAVAGNDPVPWVAWQELDGAGAGKHQIFLSRAVKQAASGTPCVGKPASGNANVNGFCWLQVGLDRLNTATGASSATGDPTLSVDPTRDAIEPDVAFAGLNDTVPWVVWYEQNRGLNGIGNELVFAAKAVPDAAADGGFHWVAVGNGTAGQTNVLNTSGANLFGACAAGATQERACSLNKDAGVDAEDPRVAAGTLTPGGATVPWVAWSEAIGAGRHGIFVSRLVGGDHFELFNQGQPISNTLNDATRPDIAFSGNTPYITWQEDVGGQHRTFSGHFEGGTAAPVFKLDTPTGVGVNTADLRPPVSSTCTANPFNADGSSCQAGAAGTPFFLHADGAAGSQHLFAQAYAASDIATGAASDVNASGGTVTGTVNPGGARAKVHFEFGPTTAYGSSTPDQVLGVASSATSFSAALTALPAGTTIHYRAVASSDFTTIKGADQSLTTAAGQNASAGTKTKIRIVSLHRIAKRHTLKLKLRISKPARVTIGLLAKKRVVRSLTVARTEAGTFSVLLSLKNLEHHSYTLRITATDARGVKSLPVTRTLRVVR
jgi:hypothetical protein